MKKEVGGGGKPGRNILKIANQKFEQAQGKEEETSTLRIHEKEAPGRNQELSAVGPVRGRARSPRAGEKQTGTGQFPQPATRLCPRSRAGCSEPGAGRRHRTQPAVYVWDTLRPFGGKGFAFL